MHCTIIQELFTEQSSGRLHNALAHAGFGCGFGRRRCIGCGKPVGFFFRKPELAQPVGPRRDGSAFVFDHLPHGVVPLLGCSEMILCASAGGILIGGGS
jgi:hypothetical protein